MAYTSHGIHIPGTDFEGAPDSRARCQGMLGCQQCKNEAAGARVSPAPYSTEIEPSTLHTIYECFHRAGVDPRKAHLVITDMQRHGILFRERNKYHD